MVSPRVLCRCMWNSVISGQRSLISIRVSRTAFGVFQPIASRKEHRVTSMPASCHLSIIRSRCASRCSIENGPSKLDPNGLPMAMAPDSAPASFAAAMAASRAAICSPWVRL